LERQRISKISARAIGETTEEEELLVVVEREREREAKEKKQKRCRGSGLPSARQPKSETRPTSVARLKLSPTPFSSRLLVVLKLCKIAWFVLSLPRLSPSSLCVGSKVSMYLRV
jgi:hypothetical protein